MNIISMTSICVDRYDNTDEVFPGGESLNFVMNWPKDTEDQIFIVGAVGMDYYGDIILEKLRGSSVRLNGLHRVEGMTANNYNYIERNGERREKLNAWEGGVYETFQLSDEDRLLISKADYVHTSINSPVFNEILSFKKKFNFKLAVDFNICRDRDRMQELAGKVDFFFISASEDILTLLRQFSNVYNGIFIGTLGQKGSICFYKGTEYKQSAIEVKEVVDTTGCGDSYQAGFLSEYIKSTNIQKSMEIGAEFAAVNAARIGAC